jgi:hypothetical protein
MPCNYGCTGFGSTRLLKMVPGRGEEKGWRVFIPPQHGSGETGSAFTLLRTAISAHAHKLRKPRMRI